MTDELWMIRGGDPVLWTMPFRLHWLDNMAEGHCPLTLTKLQQKALEARLVNMGGRQVNGLWHIHRRMLTVIGRTMPNETDPENCYSWERRRDLVRFTDQMERSEFTDALYQKGVGSRVECIYWYKQICNHIFDWLINEDRPVDMYFLRLWPCPLRTDWIRAVLHRTGLPEHSSKAKRREAGDNPTVSKLALSAAMFAYQSGGMCERHIEIEHTKLWWKVTKKVERQRMKLVNVCGYAEEFLASQRRFAEAALRIFRDWCRRSSAPCVLVRQGGKAGTRCFVQYTRTAAMRWSPSLRSQRDAQAVLRAAGRSSEASRKGKTKRMRRLRNIRQQVEKLRKGRDLAKSRKRAEGDSRLPVPNGFEKSPQVQLLAVGNDRRTTRLDPASQFLS